MKHDFFDYLFFGSLFLSFITAIYEFLGLDYTGALEGLIMTIHGGF
jgi:hypothetical protein